MISARGLNYERFGFGPPLIALPGIGLPGSSLLPVTSSLQQSFEVISVDPFGSGSQPLSHIASGSSWTAVMASAVDALVDEIQVGPAHLMGLSLGGIVAQRLLVHDVSWIDRVILISTLGTHSTWTEHVYTLRRELLRCLPPELHFRLAGLLLMSPDGFENDSEAVDRLSGPLDDPAFDLDSYKLQLDAILDHDLQGALTAVDKSVLVIGGATDLLSTPGAMADLASALPNGSLELIGGAGHGLWFQKPAELAAAINCFLLDHRSTHASTIRSLSDNRKGSNR